MQQWKKQQNMRWVFISFIKLFLLLLLTDVSVYGNINMRRFRIENNFNFFNRLSYWNSVYTFITTNVFSPKNNCFKAFFNHRITIKPGNRYNFRIREKMQVSISYNNLRILLLDINNLTHLSVENNSLQR